MSEFDPVGDAENAHGRWRAGADTFERVYDVILGVSELTAYGAVAEIADCSAKAAKKHLDRLAEMGVVRADREARPARYARDDGYLEWQEARRIAQERSSEEIVARVEELEIERDAYEERFGTSDPDDVAVFDRDDHDAVHEHLVAVGEWRSVVRDLRLYEFAYRLATNDGHLIRA